MVKKKEGANSTDYVPSVIKPTFLLLVNIPPKKI
jgi:hypothetical protein